MEHLTKTGEPRVRRDCTLPLTGHGVFDRSITDVAVFDFVGSPVRRMRLVEQLTDMPLDDLRACTEAGFDCDEPSVPADPRAACCPIGPHGYPEC